VGRPPFIWTLENSNTIKVLLALGWTNERIANAIGCSQPTLRKVFYRELRLRDRARDALRARMVTRTIDLAMSGNVGAMKLARDMVSDDMRQTQIDRAGHAKQDDDDEDAAVATRRPLPRGKKETAMETAEGLFLNDPLLSPRH